MLLRVRDTGRLGASCSDSDDAEGLVDDITCNMDARELHGGCVPEPCVGQKSHIPEGEGAGLGQYFVVPTAISEPTSEDGPVGAPSARARTR